jgi:hypothetical protein
MPRHLVAAVGALALAGGAAASSTAPPAPAQLQAAVDAFSAAHPTYPGVVLALRSPA